MLWLCIVVIHLSCRAVNEPTLTVDPQGRLVTMVICYGYALWLYTAVIHLSCRAVIEHTRTVDPQGRPVTFVTDKKHHYDVVVSKAYKKFLMLTIFVSSSQPLFFLACFIMAYI